MRRLRVSRQAIKSFDSYWRTISGNIESSYNSLSEECKAASSKSFYSKKDRAKGSINLFRWHKRGASASQTTNSADLDRGKQTRDPLQTALGHRL